MKASLQLHKSSQNLINHVLGFLHSIAEKSIIETTRRDKMSDMAIESTSDARHFTMLDNKEDFCHILFGGS